MNLFGKNMSFPQCIGMFTIGSVVDECPWHRTQASGKLSALQRLHIKSRLRR